MLHLKEILRETVYFFKDIFDHFDLNIKNINKLNT